MYYLTPDSSKVTDELMIPIDELKTIKIIYDNRHPIFFYIYAYVAWQYFSVPLRDI